MRKLIRNVVLPAALACGGLFVAVCAAEVLLRVAGVSYPVWYVPDDVLGMSLRPNALAVQRREGYARVRINSDGMRDVEHSRAKAENAYRIAVLGDSYAEAVQVELEQTFWKTLERELHTCEALSGKRVEVLNFGVSGFSTAQELLMYRTKAKFYSPDLVLLAFTTGNDIHDNVRVLDQDDTVPYFVFDGEKLVEDNSFRSNPEFLARKELPGRLLLQALQYSRTLQVVNEVRRAMKSGELPLFGQTRAHDLNDMVGAEYRPPLSAAWRNAWDVTEQLISTFHAEVVATGSKFAIATLSNPGQVNPDPLARKLTAAKLHARDLFYPEERLVFLGNRDGFLVFPLAPPLQKIATEEKIFLHGFDNAPGAGHWNAEGHARAGKILSVMICEVLGSPRT